MIYLSIKHSELYNHLINLLYQPLHGLLGSMNAEQPLTMTISLNNIEQILILI